MSSSISSNLIRHSQSYSSLASLGNEVAESEFRNTFNRFSNVRDAIKVTTEQSKKMSGLFRTKSLSQGFF